MEISQQMPQPSVTDIDLNHFYSVSFKPPRAQRVDRCGILWLIYPQNSKLTKVLVKWYWKEWINYITMLTHQNIQYSQYYIYTYLRKYYIYVEVLANQAFFRARLLRLPNAIKPVHGHHSRPHLDTCAYFRFWSGCDHLWNIHFWLHVHFEWCLNGNDLPTFVRDHCIFDTKQNRRDTV